MKDKKLKLIKSRDMKKVIMNFTSDWFGEAQENMLLNWFTIMGVAILISLPFIVVMYFIMSYYL